MHRTFLTSKFICMALVTVFLMFTSTTASFEGNLARQFFFSDHKTSTITTTTTNEEPSSSQSFSKLLSEFLSKDSDKEKQSGSFSKLALLKNFLSSSPSSSSDKNGKLDKLFQILGNSAGDDKNESSPSSNKLNHLLGFFNTHGSSSSSTNLQLAVKLLNLAQGNGGLSSLSATDMKSLIKFVNG